MNDRPLKMERIYPDIIRIGHRLGWQPIRRVSHEEMVALYDEERDAYLRDARLYGFHVVGHPGMAGHIALAEHPDPYPPPRLGRSVAGWSAEGVLWYLDVASWLARFVR